MDIIINIGLFITLGLLGVLLYDKLNSGWKFALELAGIMSILWLIAIVFLLGTPILMLLGGIALAMSYFRLSKRSPKKGNLVPNNLFNGITKCPKCGSKFKVPQKKLIDIRCKTCSNVWRERT